MYKDKRSLLYFPYLITFSSSGFFTGYILCEDAPLTDNKTPPKVPSSHLVLTLE